MAAAGQTRTIKKLQQALQFEGEFILITTTQFFSMEKRTTVTRYHVKKQIQSEERNKSSQVELFSSCSQIQITLFLRDYYYEVKGYEVPHDNPIWEAAKKKYFEEH